MDEVGGAPEVHLEVWALFALVLRLWTRASCSCCLSSAVRVFCPVHASVRASGRFFCLFVCLHGETASEECGTPISFDRGVTERPEGRLEGPGNVAREAGLEVSRISIEPPERVSRVYMYCLSREQEGLYVSNRARVSTSRRLEGLDVSSPMLCLQACTIDRALVSLRMRNHSVWRARCVRVSAPSGVRAALR